MLVWRTTIDAKIYYQWSADGARSWSAPSTLPRLFARPWGSSFDMYDMARDSAGHIHLLVVGRESERWDAQLSVYYCEWDGDSWSSPIKVYSGDSFPEYPKITISHGNWLHAVWFVHDGTWIEGAQREVYYSNTHSAAPYQTPVPSPTPTVTPAATPTATSMPAPTAYPTISSDTGGLPNGLNTENDELLQLMVALSPVALLVAAMVAARLGWLGKLFR